MSQGNGDTPNYLTISQTEFRDGFDAIAPLILEEWPQLAAEDLTATEGDLDLVIDYIAANTEHTRTLVRHYLTELMQVGKWRETPKQKLEQDSESPPKIEDYITTTLDRTIQALEGRTEKLITKVQSEMIPEVNRKAKDNIGNSLLTALGIGFILGVLFGGSGRGR